MHQFSILPKFGKRFEVICDASMVGGECIYVSGEQRAVVGEQKIDYSIVIFVEKEPLKPWKSEKLGCKFSSNLTKKIPKPWNILPK